MGTLFDSESRAAAVTAEQLSSYDEAERQIAALAVPRLFDAGDPHSRVFFALFDGTRNDRQKDAGHLTNVAILADEVEELAIVNRNVGVFYKEGPGTQDGIGGLLDAATGGSFEQRIEQMYDEFARQASHWLQEDPDARIAVISTGFSRGAEQAAAFSRLVDERGIRTAASKMVEQGPDGQAAVHFVGPALREPGTVPQSLALYDPVGTGAPRAFDRRPPPSVTSGLQICAADERRALFPSTCIIEQGLSEDGRMLGVTTAGVHSDIGGGYLAHGLPYRNFNLMAGYLNKVLGEPLVRTLDVPPEPAMNVVHDTPWYYRKIERRGIVHDLEGRGWWPHEATHPRPASYPASVAPGAVATLVIDDTHTPAFEDVGRDTGIATVLSDAAARLRDGAGLPLALQDINGAEVGRLDIAAAAQPDPLQDDAFRLTLDLRHPALQTDLHGQLADSIAAVSKQVELQGSDAGFVVHAANGDVLGVVETRHPLPDIGREFDTPSV